MLNNYISNDEDIEKGFDKHFAIIYEEILNETKE